MTENLTGNESKIKNLEAVYSGYMAAASSFLSDNDMFTPGFVWGCGDVSSDMVLIGEAPGKDEVETGKPFSGKAGSILNRLLYYTSCERSDLFITNTIKYRLARQRAGSLPSMIPVCENKSLSNRPASSKEILLASSYLKEELLILNPRLIVTLGNTPLRALCAGFFPGEKVKTVGECRGEFVKLPGFKDTYLCPVFHPASLIYNPSNEYIYIEDLKKIGEYLRNMSK